MPLTKQDKPMKNDYIRARKALEQINDIVSGDYALDTDSYLAGITPIKRSTVDIWAKMIIDIYNITHPLLSSCCGKVLKTYDPR